MITACLDILAHSVRRRIGVDSVVTSHTATGRVYRPRLRCLLLDSFCPAQHGISTSPDLCLFFGAISRVLLSSPVCTRLTRLNWLLCPCCTAYHLPVSSYRFGYRIRTWYVRSFSVSMYHTQVCLHMIRSEPANLKRT